MNAKALYDFNPKELNQLPLRKDCIVLVIGKEGDSKGWWRGKALDRVCYIVESLLSADDLIYMFSLYRLDSFPKNMFKNSLPLVQMIYDITITLCSSIRTTNPVLTTRSTITLDEITYIVSLDLYQHISHIRIMISIR